MRSLISNDIIMVLYGISAVMVGTTLPEIITDLNLTLSSGGLLISAQTVGGILALLAAAVIADRVSKARWILWSFLLLGATLLAVGFGTTFALLLLLFLVSGIATRLLDTMLNAHTGEIAGADRSRALNLLHMSFSIGAFAGPLVATGLLSAGVTWNGVYRYVGVGYIAAAVILGITGRYGEAVSATETSPPHRRRVDVLGTLRRRDVTALGVILMLYAVHQTGVSTWLPLFLARNGGMSKGGAGTGLSLYWIGIIVGRLTASFYAGRFPPIRILLFGSLAGGVICLISIVLVHLSVVAILGFVVTGVLTGATIPLAMSAAYGALPGRTGSVTAVLSAYMLLGRLIGPWSIGTAADRWGIGASIAIVAVALLGCFVAAVISKRSAHM